MEGIGSWPITMGTYVAVPKVANDTERTARVLRFFAFGNGNNALDPPAVRHYASATTQAGPNGVVAAASSRIQIAPFSRKK